MFFMALVAGSTALFALLVKPVLDDIFIEKDLFMMKFIPIAVVAVSLIKGMADYGQSYLMAYVGQRIITDMRDRLYHHLQRLSLSFFTRHSTGVLISRITNDVNLIQGAVTNAITGILKDFFTILGLLGVVFYRDWFLAIIALVVFPLMILPIAHFGRKLRKFSIKGQQKMGDITTVLHETIAGNRIVKAFGMEAYENQRFSDENRRLFRLLMKRFRIRALSSPVMETMGGVGAAIAIVVGGYRVIGGGMTPGEFFSFMTAMMMLYEPVKKLNKINLVVQEGLAAASRIFEVLDLVPEISNRPGAKPLPPIKKVIAFRNVFFRYEDQWVLKNISLEVRKGEINALVGMSGGGKTTMMNLIPRFYDVNRGAILIDGVDIRDVTFESLRAQIALVSQQSILFNDTVRSNIAYGDPNKSDGDIQEAALAANAEGFIRRLPMGYDTIIGEQGVKLSGGERQRVCIARAILKNAPILILDEATSSLDSESEEEVQKAMLNLMKDRTTFVIAHRLSTVRNADRILVVVNGEIIEQGTHEELLRLGGEYSKLYEIQFREKKRDLTVQPQPSFV
jgi:subfamily B ATP-binding cassette protein MsbA